MLLSLSSKGRKQESGRGGWRVCVMTREYGKQAKTVRIKNKIIWKTNKAKEERLDSEEYKLLEVRIEGRRKCLFYLEKNLQKYIKKW